MNNIILIGFMGSGKTSIGTLLARKLSYDFMDTDQLIEKRAGKSIKEIFALDGEEHFRKMETDEILSMQDYLQHTVLSVGGGLPIRTGNAEILRKLGTVVFLKAHIDTLKARLAGDTKRPLLSGEEWDKKVTLLLQSREPVYENAAHLIITTDSKCFEEILDEILEKIVEPI
ncbi:shikimate kinase [Anaerocolumna cellulosilytica]|uniref:Shikimate kinase n=1 Tax=Anaerocolumna cellulosilytica TaxID=433286 RepID=A0A6S6R530_9FIRM|nr:shikimate kinase [Anaerocolumna cellulosilytica]MBB5194225.1 shikimate kinase [Anaerocolumna cellulosilytica]BCJ94562.1 shikimate kinase [Anaerocolumna cellulosilytica]